jgi:outer membrane protein
VKRSVWATLVAGVGLSWCLTGFAAEPEKWLVRVGGHYVDPQSDNNDLFEVEGSAMVTFDVTYLIDPHWGVELLGALPFTHDINIVDGPKVGETDQLPPTLSVVYRFLPDGQWRPYAGVGVNWTIFFNEDMSGPLDGADLSLDQSVGLAGVVGIDIPFNDVWFFNMTVRYMDIDTDATVHLPDDGGTLDVGSVDIDPWAYGIEVGRAF